MISQDLQGLQHADFVRLVDMEKECHSGRHHDYHVEWVQFTYQTQNEDQN